MKHSNLYLGLVLPSGEWQSLIAGCCMLNVVMCSTWIRPGFSTNIRQGWKGLLGTNTPAYTSSLHVPKKWRHDTRHNDIYHNDTQHNIYLIASLVIMTFSKTTLNSECHYAECHYAECHYAECHYAECHYAECHYAQCCGAKEFWLLVLTL